MKVSNTPKHMTEEEIAILAFSHLRGTPHLSNRNVDCFIAGYKACNDQLVHQFARFLEYEGIYYKEHYSDQRRESCGYAGQPITQKHLDEFKAAQKVGELLLQAAELIKTYQILT